MNARPFVFSALTLLALGGTLWQAEARSPRVMVDGPVIGAELPPSTRAQRAPQVPKGASPAGDPAEALRLGASWLVQQQQQDGGWGSGFAGRGGGGQATSDVATTAVAVMALRRDPGAERHAAAIRRGVLHVVQAVESAPAQGSRLATPQGTQVQGKLGPLVDTHLATVLLADVVGVYEPELDQRVRAALGESTARIARAQQADGRFDAQGWAPVLSNALAVRGLDEARRQGVEVEEQVLERAAQWQAASVDTSAGDFDASTGAGVELYAVASGLSNAPRARAGQAAAAMDEVSAVARDRVGRADQRLIMGYGSMGGEEMLSYLLISDTLAADDPESFDAWQQRIGSFLQTIQNADGSWSGHHCITSTPFITAAAVMTLGARPEQAGLGQVQPTPAPPTVQR